MYCETLVQPSGGTPDEYRGYAAGCLGWARTAKSDREREIDIPMANTWFESAIRESGKDRAGISTSLPIEPADIRDGDAIVRRTRPNSLDSQPAFLLLAVRESYYLRGCLASARARARLGSMCKDAHSSTIHVAARAQLAGYSAFYGQHFLLRHARSDAAPPRQASPPNMRANGTWPACRRTRVCDPASLGHCADPSYNRPAVARFGF
jgi:hypothetical protein